VIAVRHLTMAELEAGLDEIRRAPKDRGVLQLIAGTAGALARLLSGRPKIGACCS
jgi:hypothetical protein